MIDRAAPAEDAETRRTELEAEVRRLRDFAALSSDWFWEQDAELRFTRFFGSSPEKLRRRQSDFLGKTRWEMPIGGVSEAQLQAHIATCLRHEPFRDFSYEIQAEDGAIQYYSISGMPVFGPDGQFVGYHGVGRNITELRRAGMAIAESERHLSQIVDGNAVAIFVIDADHRVTHWNRACEGLTGVPASLVVGGRESWRGFYAAPRPTMADLVIGDSPELQIAYHYANRYHRSKLLHGAFEAEDFFPQMEGGGRWLFFTAAPLRDSKGNIRGAIETLQDVTTRKTAERTEREHREKLQAAHAELQQAMRQLVETEKLASLGRMVAGISHELNTPLGNALVVASSLTEMLDELSAQVAGGSVRRSDIERLLEAGKKSGGLLIGAITRASRLVARFREIASGPDGEKCVEFPLRTLIAAVITELGEALSALSVRVDVDVDAQLRLESYPAALHTVLAGLIDNSLVHGLSDRADARISIVASVHDGHVVVSYADNGRGMSADVRRHAFDPFFTTRLGQGESGLGLYLVYNLVTAVLGGRVELLAAEQGVGVAYRLTIPLRHEGHSSDGRTQRHDAVARSGESG